MFEWIHRDRRPGGYRWGAGHGRRARQTAQFPWRPPYGRSPTLL